MAELHDQHHPGESSDARGWVVALTTPLVLSGLLVVVRSEFFVVNAALVLVLPVLAAAIVGGRQGGIAAAVVSTLCFDFFFTRPYYSLSINSRDDLETTLVLLIVGVVVGELEVRSRRSRRLALEHRREIDQIRRVAELAAGAGPRGRLITVVERELVDVLDAAAVRFERPPYPTVLVRLGHGVMTIQAERDRPAGPSNEVEIPVSGRGRELGRLVVVLRSGVTPNAIGSGARALAVALADQLGAMLAAAESS